MPADAVLTPLTTHLCTTDAVPESAEQVGAALVVVLGPDEGGSAHADVWAAARRRVADDAPVLVSQESGAKGERCVYAVADAPTTDDARRLGARVGRLGTTLDMHAEVVVAHELLSDPRRTAAFVEGLVLGGYQPTHVSRPADSTPRTASSATVVAPSAQPAARTCLVTDVDDAVLERAVVTAAASLIARNLANAPANIATPQWLADRAAAVAERAGLEITVRDEQALAAEGFGGLLAVGGGSVNPPRLVQLDYRPEGAKGSPHVVLVGKGITFDTGGISVKPADAMSAMRTDMSGSAVVLATIDAVAALGLPVRVTALMALAENTFGEASYRPGDVVTPFGGRRTVEILNTDAEGRMVLADALAYADDHLDPDVLVDVATLTGAARVALARSMGALFATEDDLAEEITAAGDVAGEPFWRLPLREGYRPLLESGVADLNNAPGGAGAITAALFLQEFVGERRWAHLDIAGPGRSDDDTALLSKGGTGYGARALITWLGGLT